MSVIHRNLRSGQTIWQGAPLPEIPSQPAVGAIETDVIIVGAGITGAIIADVMTEVGFDVALVDRRGPVRGSTVATTALIQFELDTPLFKLAEQIGTERAQRMWKRSKRAVDSLARRVEGIACDWQTRPALYLSGNLLDVTGLRGEAQARQNIGLSADFIDARQLQEAYGIAKDGAIRSQGNGEANPILLAAGLIRRALTRGAALYYPVEITDLREDLDSVIAHSKDDIAFKARTLIYATGYELADIVPRQGSRVISTWALATAPQPDRLWPTRCQMWEAADPYLYLRTTPDGRVIAGGEDEDFSNAQVRDALIGEKTAAIQRKLRALLPQIDTEADFAWTGSFGVSDTSMPSIGLIPGKSRSYAVRAFGGNGIVFSMIAAEVLRGFLRGPPDPDADLFAFG